MAKYHRTDAKDTEAIRRLQANLENLQKRKQEAFSVFEKDRQARLETLKKQEQEKLTEQIPANDIEQSPEIIEKIRLEPILNNKNKGGKCNRLKVEI